ncbi:MAG: glycosyl transferase, partial [Haloarculaceae archaeon]
GPASVVVGAVPRVALALVALVALVALAVAGAGRRIAGLDAESARRYAPLAGTLGLVAIPLPALTVLLVGLSSGQYGAVVLVALAMLLVFVGTMVVLLALGTVALAARLSLLPDRAAPLALVAAGVFAVALGGGVAGAPAPLTFLGVGAALFAWDVSEFGLGLTAELGHLPETRRVEVFHAVASAGVALAGVALAAALHATLGALVPATFALPAAMALAVLGTLVLLPGLRG